jgi:hypothetical protein
MPYGDPYQRQSTPAPPAPDWRQYGQQPPQWPAPAAAPPPAPTPKRKRSHGKLAALGLLVAGLFVACAVAGQDSKPVPPVPTAPTWGTATTSAPTPAEPTVTVADAPLQPARTITARDWQLIAKNPDQHAGERIIVYGEVVQFDATTGTGGFRANVDGVVHKPEYGYADYKTNTILDGDGTLLAQVVENDLFKAEVTVDGSKSYDTVMGGSLTAPQLTVTKIDVIGHTK